MWRPVGSRPWPSEFFRDAFCVEVVPLAAVRSQPVAIAVGAHVVPLMVVLGELPASERPTVILEGYQSLATMDQPTAIAPELSSQNQLPRYGASGDHGALAIQVAGRRPYLAGHVALGTQVMPLAVVLLQPYHRGWSRRSIGVR